MKKFILSASVVAALLAGTSAKAQLIDEQNVTVTMDLQPILQLNMNGSQNIDFVFDQISEYVGGITQYGATNLQVSSTVSWDLYAAGYSAAAATVSAGGVLVWDNSVVYGGDTDPNSVTTLPITLLELHQDKANPSTGTVTTGATAVDPAYFLAFQSSNTNLGRNNIHATSVPYVRPTSTEKYIAGHNENTAFVAGGSYLILNNGLVGNGGSYSYTMDYRIVPGLPAVFPRATSGSGNNTGSAALNATTTTLYAQPGVYTMNVKYVLVEN